MGGKRGRHHGFIADQDDLNAVFARGHNGARYIWLREVITPHGIENYPHNKLSVEASGSIQLGLRNKAGLTAGLKRIVPRGNGLFKYG